MGVLLGGRAGGVQRPGGTFREPFSAVETAAQSGSGRRRESNRAASARGRVAGGVRGENGGVRRDRQAAPQGAAGAETAPGAAAAHTAGESPLARAVEAEKTGGDRVKRAVEMTGPWKTRKTLGSRRGASNLIARVSHVSPSPLEIAVRFPHSHKPLRLLSFYLKGDISTGLTKGTFLSPYRGGHFYRLLTRPRRRLAVVARIADTAACLVGVGQSIGKGLGG